MLISMQRLSQVLATAAFALVIAGCEKTDTAAGEKGPAERAGQQLDQAAARAGDEINKAAEVAGKGLQQLGQKIQNEAEQAQQAQQSKKE